MAKEPDQTRWVGIRPTNPAENIPVVEQAPLTSIQVEPKPGSADFPVTLGAEVPHVIVDSGGGGGLQPGAPLHTEWRGLNVPTDTWYTIQEVAGAGHIQKIHLGIGTTFYYLQCRLTINGGAPVTYITTANTEVMWQDISYQNAFYKCLPVYLIRYTTSFKMEIQQTTGVNKTIYGLISWLPDPV
uniref:Uncharacterized protein n=1 Tax=viral metagenome TaxID=1070528 RepID=A0A6M3LVN5_9ZZZZ